MYEDDYDLIPLRLEVQLLHAEATVAQAEEAFVRLHLYEARYPDSETAQLLRSNRQLWSAIGRPHFHPSHPAMEIEAAAYGWRRDYGEWPTLYNLADRLATHYSGLTHRRAMKHVLAVINDPSPDAHLHAMRSVRMDEILEDCPHTCGTGWNPNGEHIGGLRFYVTAEGQEAHDLAGTYQLESYRREPAA